MKLEYLNDITGGGKYPWADPDKLLRLYDFDYLELERFKHAIERNIIIEHKELVVSDLEFVEPLNCELTFKISLINSGIKFPPNYNNNFVGQFLIDSYINMLDIIKHLSKNGSIDNGFNWLYDPSDLDQIDLLLSPGGSW